MSYSVRRHRLQPAIQDMVTRYIIDHRFKPGDALPGESELAREIGISRPSLREAMKVLQTMGVVEARHGSGTYVGSLSLNPLGVGIAFQILVAAQHSSTAPRELLDLVDLRKTLEMGQMRSVVGTHSAAQIARMRELVTEMQQTDPESARFGERDLALHQAFYQPLNNRIANEFLRVFWTISTLTVRPFAPVFRDRIIEDHDRIVDAIAGLDTEAAVATLAGHLAYLDETIRTSYNPETLRVEALRSFGSEDEDTEAV